MEAQWKSSENYRFDRDMFSYLQHLYRKRYQQYQKDLDQIHLTDSRIHVICKDNLTSKEEAGEVIERCDHMVRQFQTDFCQDTDIAVNGQELPKAREVINSFQTETDNAIFVSEHHVNDVIVLTIMAMNQGKLLECKHRLKVGLERIKKNISRAKRKIEIDVSKELDASVQHSVDGKILLGDEKILMTYEGMKVCVCKKDIVEWNDPKACVVNPINAHFKPAGGVSRALMKKGGDEFNKRMKELSEGEPGKPGDCFITEVYNLKVLKILTVVCPRGKLAADVIIGQRCNRTIFNCVYNCMMKAEEDKMNTVVLPFLFTGTLGRPVDRCCWQYAYAVLEYSRKHKTRESHLRNVVFVNLEKDKVDVAISVFNQAFPSSFRQFFRIIERMPFALKETVAPNTEASNNAIKQKTENVASTSTDANDQAHREYRGPESDYFPLSKGSIHHSSDVYTSLEVSDTQHLLDERQQSPPEEYVAMETNSTDNEYHNIPMLSLDRDKSLDSVSAKETNSNNTVKFNLCGRLVDDKTEEDSGCKNILGTTEASNNAIKQKTENVASTSTDANDQRHRKYRGPESDYFPLSKGSIHRSSDVYISLEVSDTPLSKGSIHHSSDVYPSLEVSDTQHLLDERQQSPPEEYVAMETNSTDNEYHNIPMLSLDRDKSLDSASAKETNSNNTVKFNLCGRLVDDKTEEDSGCKNILGTKYAIENLGEHKGTNESVNSSEINSAKDTKPKTAMNSRLEKPDSDNHDKNAYDTIDDNSIALLENVPSIENEKGEVHQIKPNASVTESLPRLNEQESCAYRLQATDQHTSNKADQHTSSKGNTRQSCIQNFGGKIEVIFVNKDIRDFNSVALVSPVADTKDKPDGTYGNDRMAAAIKAAYHVTFFDNTHEKKLQKLCSHKSHRKYATYSICSQEDFSQGRAKYIFHVVLPTYRSTKAMSEFQKGLTVAFDALMTKIRKVNKKDNSAVRELALPLFGLDDSSEESTVKEVCDAVASCLYNCIVSQDSRSMRYLMRKVYIVNWCPRVISLFEEAFAVVHNKHQK